MYMKKAVICADSFHVIKQLNDSLSKLRVRIMKRYNPDSIEYYLLKKWKFLLFDRSIDLDNKGKFNKRLNRYINYRQLLEDLIRDFVLANIPEFEKFTTAICNCRKEIVNSFLTYKGRRINNDVAEILNSTISLLLFNTRGIRNVERRRKRIMYAVNKTGFMIK